MADAFLATGFVPVADFAVFAAVFAVVFFAADFVADRAVVFLAGVLPGVVFFAAAFRPVLADVEAAFFLPRFPRSSCVRRAR